MELLKVKIGKDKDGDMFIVKINRADGTPYKEYHRLHTFSFVWTETEWRLDMFSYMEDFIRQYKGDTKNPFYLAIHWMLGKEIADRAVIRYNHDKWLKIKDKLVSLTTGENIQLNDNELYSVISTMSERQLTF